MNNNKSIDLFFKQKYILNNSSSSPLRIIESVGLKWIMRMRSRSSDCALLHKIFEQYVDAYILVNFFFFFRQ